MVLLRFNGTLTTRFASIWMNSSPHTLMTHLSTQMDHLRIIDIRSNWYWRGFKRLDCNWILINASLNANRLNILDFLLKLAKVSAWTRKKLLQSSLGRPPELSKVYEVSWVLLITIDYSFRISLILYGPLRIWWRRDNHLTGMTRCNRHLKS